MVAAMRIFIAGGGGAVGRPLVAQLVERGHQVVATTRSPQKLEALRALGAEPVVMDGLDAQSVAEAVAAARPEVVVHEMTALAGLQDFKHFDDSFAVTNRLRTEGTQHLLAAARTAGARRFVAQSFAGWPMQHQGGPVTDEESPFDPHPPAAQRRSFAAIRALEDAVTHAAIPSVVLRYGSLYGPGASDGMLPILSKRRFPVIGNGAGVWSWLHVEDAASATVAAIESTVTGIFNIVDDEPAPVSEWLPYLAETLQAPPPRHVPRWLGRIVGGEVTVAMMTEVRGSSNAKARRELHWQPRWSSWREGFRHALTASPEAALR